MSKNGTYDALLSLENRLHNFKDVMTVEFRGTWTGAVRSRVSNTLDGLRSVIDEVDDSPL